MNVKEKTIKMLTENTGTHMMDSGGAYGRHWQRNQDVKEWDNKHPLMVHYGGEYFELDVYTFITNCLETNETTEIMDQQLEKMSKDKQLYGLQLICEYSEQLEKQGWHVEKAFNTYNGESMLSQVLQGCWVSMAGPDWCYEPSYLILQIHNGCDVRGGYTEPKVFFAADPSEWIMSDSDIDANCDCGSIYSDDYGYHWYLNDGDLSLEGDKLPESWKPDKRFKTENTQYRDHVLKCSKCGKIPAFISRVEYMG